MTLLIYAPDENAAYDHIADSGFSSGAMIGTVQVLNLDVVEETYA